MKNKIGRNDPCPCGSINAKTQKPIKYKKCCLINPKSKPDLTVIAQMKMKLDQQSAKRKEILRTKGIFIDFPAPTNFQGKSMWALGSRIYYHPQEDLTFHECLFAVLSQELGNEWIQEQENLPLDKRHFIMQCHDEYVQWRKRNSIVANQEGDNNWSAIPDGLTKSLLALSFDVACIIHTHGKLPVKILERLKKSDNIYQGARYEIAVAAIFARLGCEFEFLDETLDGLEQVPGHCEFFATDKETNTTVAVEAKSKVRKGILHQPGQAKDFQLWNNVTGPYRNALSQNPEDTPFFVFVDVNAPPTPKLEPLDKPWADEILKSREKTPLNKPGKPDPCTAIIYTNYSYHYQTKTEARANEAIMVIPAYPKHPVSEIFLGKLRLAVENYSYVPNIERNGIVR